MVTIKHSINAGMNIFELEYIKYTTEMTLKSIILNNYFE